MDMMSERCCPEGSQSVFHGIAALDVFGAEHLVSRRAHLHLLAMRDLLGLLAMRDSLRRVGHPLPCQYVLPPPPPPHHLGDVMAI